MQGELPNIVTILAEKTHEMPLSASLHTWENLVFSLIVIGIISLIVFFASVKIRAVPGRAQAACELYVGGVDDFVCGIIGPAGRKFVPFIGTLFIYILFMNLCVLVPFMKSSTSSWSTTMALALCVFFYLQYTSIREHGIIGYVDHLLGRPRGIIAATVFVPIMMLLLHIVSELVRPISLSLRLRSNIWGDDMLIAVLAHFGIKGVPILFFNSLIVVLASIVQAVVFSLLTTIYFALALANEEE
jgi:F-type H+-transporting ATPase subunit a